MEEKMCICPFCGAKFKRGNPRHTYKCRLNYIANLSEEEKEKYWDLYVNQELSIVQVSKIMNLPYHQIQRILPSLGIKVRNLKESVNTADRKRRYEETVMKHFGTRHNFCKECPSRKEWEERLLREEGITNVFQREDVKKKIKTTILEKYGTEGVYYNYTKGSTLQYWIEKLGEEDGKKRYDAISYAKSHTIQYYIDVYGEEKGQEIYKSRLKRTHSGYRYYGLNQKAYSILERNEIQYEPEFRLECCDRMHNYYYDIKVGNLLIELNGVYWHCSPKKYQPHDIVIFPHNVPIVAQDKWEADKKKCERAKELGYEIETIWEDEFSEEVLLNVIKKHNYGKC